MKVTVFSSLAGETSGYIAFHVPANCLVKNLLKLYCSEKGVRVAKDYVLCGRGNVVLDPQKTLEEEGIKDGDSVSLSIDEIKGQLYEFGSWYVISFIALAIGLLGLAYSVIFYTSSEVAAQKYGLVIDAGSSHSQLLVFSWSNLPEQEMEELVLVHDCIMPGGIAEFRMHPRDLFSYFRACLDEAKNVVPVSARPKTPLILAATGGMRILQAYDPQGAELVLLAIRTIFSSTTGFLTRYEDVFVASGQQEGINGWTALNYLMQNFQESENQSAAQVSALDLGGASFQVTTELSKDETKWPMVNITLFNNIYSVYSKSFLCYGIGAAMHRYLSLLLLDLRPDTTHIWNPCLPKGLDVSITSEDLLDPCILSNKSRRVRFKYPNQFSNAYVNKYILRSSVLPSYEMNLNNSVIEKSDSGKSIFVLKGSSNPQRCEKEVRKLFDYNLCKKNFVLGDCLNKKLIPPYKGELVGFSSIFHKLLPLLGITKEEGPEELKTAVLEVCSMSARNLKEKHPNLTRDMIQDMCFDGMYIYNLLSDGLGIKHKQWKNILFTNKVKKQDIVWAMGLILNRTSNIVPQKTIHYEQVGFCVLVASFCVFIVVGFIFLVYFYKLKQRGNVYQRVQVIAASA